ncbi:hypothetical protein Agub_g11998 [Astrephomene gubernaculifera]|uniref:Nicastrin n=1 Tax=Astrephomene gubernaculifera TaxID=47775 RepID=A0AAD3HQB2_9CHLO|nr:hypothetical protein Agub_g11998 [Astrephomene gubernaculifera]
MFEHLRCAVLLIALLCLLSSCAGSGPTGEWKQLKDLRASMYAEMKYSRACIKLMTRTGPQGCEAADQELITAPLVYSYDLPALPRGGRKVVVLPASDVDPFLTRLETEPALREQVAGVLVDPTSGLPARQSVAPTFPGAAFAPYSAPSYVWNPAGTGFNRHFFGIPMYILTGALANETSWRAAYNAENKLKGGRHVARMQLPMQAEGNSSQCIQENTCLPVGGYGVWTALPPLPDPSYNTTGSARPITLLLAQTDSNSLFHDATRAAGTATSGLVACLVALNLLARAGLAGTYGRQLAFAALPGEAFDFMGSKRLLYEMSLNSSYVQGLRLDLIDQVLEVGQVGSAFDDARNRSSFFVHSQRTAGFGNASALLAAAQTAATLEAPQVSVQSASAANPGIPPSSLMSFLRVKPSIAGAVLSDFDSAFTNPYYQSDFDIGTNVSLEALVDASLLVARTLHLLAASPATPPLQLNRTLALYLVADLVVCLVWDTPGMRCPTAALLMSPDIQVFYDGTTSAAVSAYPGVLPWVDADPKASRSKPNLARFLFNYLGNITAAPLPANRSNSSWEGAPCDTTVNICPASLACIGWRYSTTDTAGMGRCRNTSTNYVPAYSTRLWYGFNKSWWGWWLSDAAADWEAAYDWPPDPMWAESNWPARTPTLTVFQEESTRTQVATLVVGLLLSVATAAVSWAGVKAFERHLKTQ